MPEWGWGLIGGVIVVAVGQIIGGLIQWKVRKAKEKETRRRDSARAALEFMRLFLDVVGPGTIVQILNEKSKKEFNRLIGKKEEGTFEMSSQEQRFFELFKEMFNEFRSEFEK